MSPLEPGSPTGPEYSSMAEAQEKGLKTTCMKMIAILKEEVNKSLRDI